MNAQAEGVQRSPSTGLSAPPLTPLPGDAATRFACNQQLVQADNAAYFQLPPDAPATPSSPLVDKEGHSNAGVTSKAAIPVSSSAWFESWATTAPDPRYPSFGLSTFLTPSTTSPNKLQQALPPSLFVRPLIAGATDDTGHEDTQLPTASENRKKAIVEEPQKQPVRKGAVSGASKKGKAVAKGKSGSAGANESTPPQPQVWRPITFADNRIANCTAPASIDLPADQQDDFPQSLASRGATLLGNYHNKIPPTLSPDDLILFRQSAAAFPLAYTSDHTIAIQPPGPTPFTNDLAAGEVTSMPVPVYSISAWVTNRDAVSLWIGHLLTDDFNSFILQELATFIDDTGVPVQTVFSIAAQRTPLPQGVSKNSRDAIESFCAIGRLATLTFGSTNVAPCSTTMPSFYVDAFLMGLKPLTSMNDPVLLDDEGYYSPGTHSPGIIVMARNHVLKAGSVAGAQKAILDEQARRPPKAPRPAKSGKVEGKGKEKEKDGDRDGDADGNGKREARLTAYRDEPFFGSLCRLFREQLPTAQHGEVLYGIATKDTLTSEEGVEVEFSAVGSSPLEGHYGVQWWVNWAAGDCAASCAFYATVDVPPGRAIMRYDEKESVFTLERDGEGLGVWPKNANLRTVPIEIRWTPEQLGSRIRKGNHKARVGEDKADAKRRIKEDRGGCRLMAQIHKLGVPPSTLCALVYHVDLVFAADRFPRAPAYPTTFPRLHPV
ncbi:hypothetical protein JCM10296v2_006174 [Rhodotorula toruloides]